MRKRRAQLTEAVSEEGRGGGKGVCGLCFFSGKAYSLNAVVIAPEDLGERWMSGVSACIVEGRIL